MNERGKDGFGTNRRDRHRRPALRSRATALAGGLLLSAFGSGAVLAQNFDDREMPMPPRAVVWRLNDRGFTAVTRPQFDGRAYVVEADDPYGERVRVFVDARDGAILRRQTLAMAPPPMRAGRAAPGYGWTEEEAIPRRPVREAERIVPPGDLSGIPAERRPAPVRAPAPRVESVDRNPMGLNPDAGARPEAPVKAARLAPAPKPVPARVVPAAPRLSETPPAKPGAAVKPPEAAALEAPKATTTPTPAAVQPPLAEARAAKDWKDPPADQKRPVRVIGGATLVPGGTAAADSKD